MVIYFNQSIVFLKYSPFVDQTSCVAVMPVFVLRLCTKFEVRRLSRSEDIGHLLCEH